MPWGQTHDDVHMRLTEDMSENGQRKLQIGQTSSVTIMNQNAGKLYKNPSAQWIKLD